MVRATQNREQRRLIRLAASMNNKAKLLGARGSVTAADLARIVLRSRTCAYCPTRLEIGQGSFDHAIPFERGGANAFHNIVRCCFACQRSKYTKTPQEYLTFVRETDGLRCETCHQPMDRPRYGDWVRGLGRNCSRSCNAKRRWELA